MAERYDATFRFRKEEISDEEYNELVSRIEDFDQVEIETHREDIQEARLSDPATTADLTAMLIIVNGVNALISLYQIAQDHPAFAGANIRDESEEEFVRIDEAYINIGAVEKDAIVGKVEADVYLVKQSDIDFEKVAKAGTKYEEREE